MSGSRGLIILYELPWQLLQPLLQLLLQPLVHPWCNHRNCAWFGTSLQPCYNSWNTTAIGTTIAKSVTTSIGTTFGASVSTVYNHYYNQLVHPVDLPLVYPPVLPLVHPLVHQLTRQLLLLLAQPKNTSILTMKCATICISIATTNGTSFIQPFLPPLARLCCWCIHCYKFFLNHGFNGTTNGARLLKPAR